tara:strand:- start:76 stop:420 length:345 start_codon:yes stop_codon:yes gene_type:complete
MLGKFFVKTADNGGRKLTGAISTRDVYCNFELRPCDERKDEKSPHYDIWAISPKHGNEYHAGVAWENKPHPEYGKSFSLAFDGEEKTIIVGEVRGQDGVFNMRYLKDKEQAQAA